MTMSPDEYDFMKQQFLTLRTEISESKSRIFRLLILGIILVLVAGFMAAEYPSAFANAAIPFLILALMLTFISEQNNISRAGRYLREVVEPCLPELTCWENWLEGNHHRFREVDSAFVIGFSLFFLIFFAITASLTLAHLDKHAHEAYVWSAAIAYTLSAFCVLVVLVRHWNSCKAEKEK
jgi:O-antigen/teichoic acid export membrane protein